MNIVVYCGSRSGNDPIYLETAKKLGELIALNKHTLVYGGSSVGIMGEIANSVRKNGGKVIGVRPEGFKEGDANSFCDEMHITKDMANRKAKMIELGDIFLAFPGGTGTLDEISEVIVLNSCELINKKYGLLNLNGFYDTLLKFFNEVKEKDFMTSRQLNEIKSFDTLEDFFDYIND